MRCFKFHHARLLTQNLRLGTKCDPEDSLSRMRDTDKVDLGGVTFPRYGDFLYFHMQTKQFWSNLGINRRYSSFWDLYTTSEIAQRFNIALKF